MYKLKVFSSRIFISIIIVIFIIIIIIRSVGNLEPTDRLSIRVYFKRIIIIPIGGLNPFRVL